MDAIDLLQHQHEEIDHLLLMVEGNRGPTRQEHFVRLARALTIHAYLEEEQFHVAMRRSQTVDALRASEADHAHIRGMLVQMARMDNASREFQVSLHALRELVESHIAEERAVLFPEAHQVFGPEGLAVLAESMNERLAELERPDGIETFSADAYGASA